MRGFFVFIVGLFFAIGVNAQDRVIITGDNLGKMASTVVKNDGKIIKALGFKSALVALVTENTREALEDVFGDSISIEADIIFSLIGKPAGKPDKPGKPPKDDPPDDPEPEPTQETPWGIERIGAISAHAITRGSGVTVCIVDTGIDFDHADLQANIVGGVNTISTRKSANDDNGHGTHCAGTIAAIDNEIGVIGVAPDAMIFAVKGLDRKGNGWSSDLAEGIHACINNGADVISMSWGSASPSQLIQDAVISAENSGLILVGAAGNESTAVIYPAAFSEVIAVSAVDSSMNFASFSNFGSEVEFAAPGVNILSTYKNGAYAYSQGTSMAAPHVAGVAALMLSAGKTQLFGENIGLPAEQQGIYGLIDALTTVSN